MVNDEGIFAECALDLPLFPSTPVVAILLLEYTSGYSALILKVEALHTLMRSQESTASQFSFPAVVWGKALDVCCRRPVCDMSTPVSPVCVVRRRTSAAACRWSTRPLGRPTESLTRPLPSCAQR